MKKGKSKITKTFKNVDPAKQRHILNAALKEFSEKGFELASTNQIVKDAGIGKGMLFYYFTNKKSLYLYLIEYCIEIIDEKYLDLIDTRERDLFERLKEMSMTKLEFLMKYPDAMNFMATILFRNFEQLDERLKSWIVALQEKGNEKTYENIDYSLFREDIDAKKAFKLIQWTFKGYEEEMNSRLREQDLDTIDYESYWAEFYEYLAIMKTSFYKREGDVK